MVKYGTCLMKIKYGLSFSIMEITLFSINKTLKYNKIFISCKLNVQTNMNYTRTTGKVFH